MSGQGSDVLRNLTEGLVKKGGVNAPPKSPPPPPPKGQGGSSPGPAAEQKMSNLLKIIGNPGTCGCEHRPGCSAGIWWVTTKSGAHTPLNSDGTSHFATCRNLPECPGF